MLGDRPDRSAVQCSSRREERDNCAAALCKLDAITRTAMDCPSDVHGAYQSVSETVSLATSKTTPTPVAHYTVQRAYLCNLNVAPPPLCTAGLVEAVATPSGIAHSGTPVDCAPIMPIGGAGAIEARCLCCEGPPEVADSARSENIDSSSSFPAYSMKNRVKLTLECPDEPNLPSHKGNTDASPFCCLPCSAVVDKMDLDVLARLLSLERSRAAHLSRREDELRKKLVASEELRLLYQLYFERLLDFIRFSLGKSDSQLCSTPIASLVGAPLVTIDEIVSSLSEALWSADARSECCGDFNKCDAEQSAIDEKDAPGSSASSKVRSLSNATLLAFSMLESKVADSVELLRREEVRRQNAVRQLVESTVHSFTEEAEAFHAVVLSSLRKLEQRYSYCLCTVKTHLQKEISSAREATECVEKLKKQLESVSRENARVLRDFERAKLELNSLKRELAGIEANRESTTSVTRMSECIDQARKSICQTVQSAVCHVRQSVMDSNTLSSSFIQSIRLIAVKVEAQVELLREELRGDQFGDLSSTVWNDHGLVDVPIGDEEICRLVASPLHAGNLKGIKVDWSQNLPTGWRLPRTKKTVILGSSLVLLEEMCRVLKNVCCLLENNAWQMADHTTQITQKISRWEANVNSKVRDLLGLFSTALLSKHDGRLSSREDDVEFHSPRDSGTSLPLRDKCVDSSGESDRSHTLPPSMTAPLGPNGTSCLTTNGAGKFGVNCSFEPSFVSSANFSLETSSAPVASLPPVPHMAYCDDASVRYKKLLNVSVVPSTAPTGTMSEPT